MGVERACACAESPSVDRGRLFTRTRGSFRPSVIVGRKLAGTALVRRGSRRSPTRQSEGIELFAHDAHFLTIAGVRREPPHLGPERLAATSRHGFAPIPHDFTKFVA
jgi:hypothetical protein